MKRGFRELISSPMLFLETLLRLVLIELALRRRPLPKITRWLSQRPQGKARNLPKVLLVAGIIERRLLRDPSCLRSSLVCFWLARPGARFIMGVRRGNSASLEAHAWVEADGSAVSSALDHASYQNIFEARRASRL